MRRLVLQMGVTLDGSVHDAQGYEADWPEGRIATGELGDDIDGSSGRIASGVMVAHGGAGVHRRVMREGLIDEYRLVIHPLAIGHGSGLFGAPREASGSTSSRPARSRGTMIHTYRLHEGNR